jgi:transcriptional regulator with XRE-family HTH domain
MNTLGQRIRELRKDRNISVLEMSEYLKTSMKVIYNIESDNSEPNIEMLILLSKRLNKSIDYLCKGE